MATRPTPCCKRPGLRISAPWLGAAVLLALLSPQACSGSGGDTADSEVADTALDTADRDTAARDTAAQHDAETRDTAAQHDAETRDAADPDTVVTPYRPEPGVSWQWQLSGTLDVGVDAAVYDIDLEETPATTIAALRAEGRRVLCYFSAGSFEEWRADAPAFDPADIGAPLDGWPGESWLDVRSPRVRAIMEARLDLAVTKGCDGVEPDNVDGAFNDTGFALAVADTQDYLVFLSEAAHARGLSVGLKNTVDLADAVEPYFDWALSEECLAYDECGGFAPFLDHGKAVFHAEYVDATDQGAARAASVCADPRRAGLSTLIKTWDLDAWRIACL